VAILEDLRVFAEDWTCTLQTDKVFGGKPKQSAVLIFHISQQQPPADRVSLNDATYRSTT